MNKERREKLKKLHSQLEEAVWEARKASEPSRIEPGEWHLPFISFEDEDDICSPFINLENGDYDFDKAMGACRKVSVARCARVSYESFETGRRSTVEEDLKLFDRLASSGHWSPFEHQATPDEFIKQGGFDPGDWPNSNEHGNFIGWRQYRKTLPGEALAPLPEAFL